MRRKLELAVERLLAILDTLDGDPDHEPSLGSPENHPLASCRAYLDGRSERESQLYWSGGNDDDREGDEHDGREPDDDAGQAAPEWIDQTKKATPSRRNLPS